MKHALISVLAIISFAGVAHAQITESPLTQESGRKISGSYHITNEALVPIALMVDVYSVDFDAQGEHFRPLDPSVHIQLSDTSARLAPKQSYEIDFKGKCDTYPCAVAFVNHAIVGHTQGDKDHPAVQIGLVIPELIYACTSAKDCRKNTLSQAGLLALVK